MTRALMLTHDLTPENWHLMPWRTIVEVSARLTQIGWPTKVASLGSRSTEVLVPGLATPVAIVSKTGCNLVDQLRALVLTHGVEVVFWPMTWRSPCTQTGLIGKLGVPGIGYFSGAQYRLGDTVYAARRLGFCKTLPYFLESLSPRAPKMRCARRNGFGAMIAMTDAMAREIVDAGWDADRTFSIPPGRDDDDGEGRPIASVLPSWADRAIGDQKFVLYAGPPSAIRGVFELLDAFEVAADRVDDFKLVCLFRADGVLDSGRIEDRINKSRHRTRVVATWTSVDSATLRSFYARCHAVVLPFLLVPSEIPLVFIEILRWGCPVISTKVGGTGEFASRYGLTAEVGDERALGQALIHILNDTELHHRLRVSASNLYREHPTWDAVASHWGRAASLALENRRLMVARA